MDIKKKILGNILVVEQKEKRKVYRLFGKTIFRCGEKRRGIYDMKSILEKYTGVKTDIKKYEIQHGWLSTDKPLITDLNKNIQLYFTWSKRLKDEWEKISNVKCEVITSPFVIYRRMNNITQNKDAKGTIAYPYHSTHQVKGEYDIDKYCEVLKSLPEEFQPVTISLHHSDIEEYNMDKEYEKRGFKVVCASYGQGDKQFYEAFYDILKNYKYATANEPGSQSFYAIEMGIPFFLAGEQGIVDNRNNLDINGKTEILKTIDEKYGKIAIELFSAKPYGVITQEQKDFVESELGINDGLSKEELIKVLQEVKK